MSELQTFYALEKVTKAINDADAFWRGNWKKVAGKPHDEFVARAAFRAAIKAIREPTWPMMDAGAELTGDDPGNIFRAMIDTILKDTPDEPS